MSKGAAPRNGAAYLGCEGAFDRFRVAEGHAVFGGPGGFDHVVRDNVFVLEKPADPAVLFAAPDCTGIELTGNRFYGPVKTVSGFANGVGLLARDEGNTVAPLADPPSAPPVPPVPSIFLWERAHARTAPQASPPKPQLGRAPIAWAGIGHVCFFRELARSAMPLILAGRGGKVECPHGERSEVERHPGGSGSFRSHLGRLAGVASRLPPYRHRVAAPDPVLRRSAFARGICRGTARTSNSCTLEHLRFFSKCTEMDQGRRVFVTNCHKACGSCGISFA